MRYLSWIISVPLALLAISFAISNRDMITLQLEPLPFAATMPVYWLGLGALVAGFILGACITGLGALGYRYRAHSLARRVAALEEDLATFRQEPATAETMPAAPPNSGTSITLRSVTA